MKRFLTPSRTHFAIPRATVATTVSLRLLTPILLTILALTAFAQTPDPNTYCHLTGTLERMNSGRPAIRVEIKILRVVKNGVLISSTPDSTYTDSSGAVSFYVRRGATACFYAPIAGLNRNATSGTCFEIPDSSSANFASLVPVTAPPATVAFPSLGSANNNKYLRITSGAVVAADPHASPALTGTPTTPTASTGTNTTQIASTAFVQNQIAATVPDADIATDGKARLGERAAYAIASLPTCDASRVNATVNVTDGNRGQRTCRNTDGSNYNWVDDSGGVFNVANFGASPSATASANSSAFAAAFTAAGSDAVVYVPPGNYALSSTITGGARKLRGAGWNLTTLTLNGTGFVISTEDLSVVEDLSITGNSSCDGGIDLTDNGWAEINRVYIRDLTKSGSVGVKIENGVRIAINWLFVARVDIGATFKNTTTTSFDTAEFLGCRTHALQTLGAGFANIIYFNNVILESNECNVTADFTVGDNRISFLNGWVEDEGAASASPIIFKLGDSYASQYNFENTTFSVFRPGYTGTATYIYAMDDCPLINVGKNHFAIQTSSDVIIRTGGTKSNLSRSDNLYIAYTTPPYTASALSTQFTIGSNTYQTVRQDKFTGTSADVYYVNSSPQFTAKASKSSDVPIVVEMASGHSTDALRVQDSSANVLVTVNSAGTLRTPRLLTRDSGAATIWQIQNTTPATMWEWNLAGTTGLDVYEYTNNRTWMRWLPSTHRFSIGSNMVFSWAQSSTANDTLDTGIARNAAGVLEVNNGTANTYRDIKLRAIESTGYAHADLPAANNGTILYCSDCTLASPCASGGTGAIAKRLNGAWVCN